MASLFQNVARMVKNRLSSIFYANEDQNTQDTSFQKGVPENPAHTVGVTIQVAKHESRPVSADLRPQHETSQSVLEKLARYQKNIGPILVTALGQQTSIRDERLKEMQFSIKDHGLVRAAYFAYSMHHNLVLRPEDIWFAILTQFSFYVNAHSEELRSSFVAHEGKKGLILRDPAQPDMGLMCQNMTKLIEQNIVDPELRKWILPSFTTTTENDEVVAAVIMMGTMRKYTEYVIDGTCCGIPSVTLLGELSDWQDLQQRIEKLSTYGEEPAIFCATLRPVLDNMVASFIKGPEDPQVVDFWSRIISRNSGSGSDTLNGWMVAFCFWDETGKCLAKNGEKKWYQPQSLLGVDFHTVEFNEVPSAFVSAPVTYMTPDGGVISTRLLAGHVGFESTANVNNDPSSVNLAKKEPDTLRPLTGWWMFKVKHGKHTGKSRGDLNDWNGQASTGYVYVQPDGMRVKVEMGLPKHRKTHK